MSESLLTKGYVAKNNQEMDSKVEKQKFNFYH